MDFELTQDQTMLQDALQRFVSGEYSFEQRGKILASQNGFSENVWRGLAEQGVLGVGLPEEHGGLGGPFETMVVMEQLGRGLVLEPFLTTVVLCGGLIAKHGSSTQKGAVLPRVVSGECRLALAHGEQGARYKLDYVKTVARERKGGYSLTGAKTVALDAPLANYLIVSAHEESSKGITLFLVDATAAGVDLVKYRTQDGRTAADVKLKDVMISRDNVIGEVGGGLAILEQALDLAIAALCAEAVGVIEALNETTLEYLKSRQQFGQPIGRFQVLQHRMADMFIMAVQARSMSVLASGHAGSPDAGIRRRAVSAAKVFIGKAGRFVGQQAVQLHGGMGMTAELVVSHYFKRLTMINATFGDGDHHLGVFSDQILASHA
jgi:alkylation response protein AidB-like acyl-CoA dehydrogenase